ncbi:hypothetical protein BsWGS_02052 [Bradybaena similaris]
MSDFQATQLASHVSTLTEHTKDAVINAHSSVEEDKLSAIACRFEECHDSDASDLSTNPWSSSSAADSFITSESDSALTTLYTPDKESHVSQNFDPSSYERGFNSSANAGIFLCSVGIFANLLLFAVLIRSKSLRVQHLYVQVLNIALADLCYIVLVDSFTVYFELQSWSLGAAFCKVRAKYATRSLDTTYTRSH